MVKLLLTFLLFSSTGMASVLPVGQYVLFQDFSLTSSHKLWTKDSNELTFLDANGKRATQQFISTHLSVATGLPWGSQLEVGVSYSLAKMRRASFGGANSGDSQSFFNEFKLKYTKNLFELSWYSLNLLFEYVNPVRSGPREESFLALNDYTHDFSLGLEEFLYWGDFYFVGLAYYKFRTSSPKDQLGVQVLSSFTGWSLLRPALGLAWVHTLGGIDVFSNDFFNNASNGQFPFHLKRERYFAWELSLERDWKPGFWTGLALNRKFWGRNTNIGNTYRLYYGFVF